LANAFKGYSHLAIHEEYVGRYLVIDEIRIGSLLVLFRDVLETASAALTLWGHREFLGGFVSQMNDALTMIRHGNSPLPKFRTAIEAMSAPIRVGSATELTLRVEGDNNVIFVINGDAAEAIQAFLDSQPRTARREASLVAAMHPQPRKRKRTS
jgi:hypothetical protein